MLTRVQDLPPYVFGVLAEHDVTAHEVKFIISPGLMELESKYNEIYYILILNTHIENFSAGAWIHDMLIGLKFFTSWKKVAVVTDQLSVKKFADAFNYLSFGYVKGFALSEIDEAKLWISVKVED